MKHHSSPFRRLRSPGVATASVSSMSPHRSTQSSKDWGAKVPERKLSFQETGDMSYPSPEEPSHDVLSYPELSELSDHSQGADPITALPTTESSVDERRTRHSRCISNESFAAISHGELSYEGAENATELDTLPMLRKVSLEPVEDLFFSGSESSSELGSKRRRNSSISEEMLEGEYMFQSEECNELRSAQRKPRKRRRLHERKRAMVAQDFDDIFSQLESLDAPTHSVL